MKVTKFAKKLIPPFAISLLICMPVLAQSDDDLFGDDMFDGDSSINGDYGLEGDDALFGDDMFSGDDSFFGDDMIGSSGANAEGSFKKDAGNGSASAGSNGVIFSAGNIKIGGRFNTEISTSTTLYDPDNEVSFGTNLKESTLTPAVNADITLDARPTNALRMYAKFGVKASTSSFSLDSLSGNRKDEDDGESPELPEDFSDPDAWQDYFNSANFGGLDLASLSGISSALGEWFSLKEMFTDFNVKDRAFFRFGIHTVSWGTGLFFSPVSDMINTSSIDPENYTDQVNGSLNLRTQVVFPNTQNTLWFYLVPDLKSGKLIDTAVAAKGEFLAGNWELGGGAFLKYHSAPKFMATASGSIIHSKVSVFAEGVYTFGTEKQWKDNPETLKSKSDIFQATAGAMYIWKDMNTTFIAQYYFDSNKAEHEYYTYGSNVAGTVVCSKLFGNSDLTGTILGLFYINSESIDLDTENMTASELQDKYNELTANGANAFMPVKGIVSAQIAWNPVDNITVTGGPYIMWTKLDNAPVTSLRLGFKLGGGKF